MKTLASLFGILSMAAFITACGADMNAINQWSDKAEGSAARAEASAKRAEDASAQANAAAKKAEEVASGAGESVRRANDVVARMEEGQRGDKQIIEPARLPSP
jgi:methyl-accepting chemotaxis protein